MLYHYTSPEVIMRMIRDEGICLRFSRYDCLNDTSEGREAVTVQQEICEELRDEYASDEKRITLLDSIAAMRPDFKSIYVEGGRSEPIRHLTHMDADRQNATVRNVSAVPYICSFSRERDALNMWNYYTSGARYEGYNVGISVEGLHLQVCETDVKKTHKSCPELKCEWWQVIYDKTQQRDKIKEEIERILKEGGFSVEKYIAQLNNWAIRFKNEVFRHEKEERLVCYVPEEELDNGATLDDYIQFRVKNGCLIPYLDVLVADKSALREITIGPLIEKKMAENTMELFLRLNGYENVEIYTSNAPIRY